jgi:N-acetyl-alpha-D-glucosaminyl L-malate synthase BshA
VWSPEIVDALVARVVAVSREAPLDVLHFHYALPFAAIADRVARRLGPHAPALVGTLHGTDVSRYGRQRSARRRLSGVLQRFDALTTVSRPHARLAMETFGLADQPEVIPNFVDVERFRPGRPFGAGRRLRILHVSNFREVKQPLSVARIYRSVRHSVDAELWLVGDGEGMTGVQGLLADAALTRDTVAFGLRLDLERILPQGDVLLVTSSAESFCLAALEAAACGVPVVAPNVGGLPDTVLDGVTGDLYPPGDENAAARLVVRMLSDRRRRESLAAAAVQRARAFAREEIVPSYLDLYENVLNGSRRARDAVAG